MVSRLVGKSDAVYRYIGYEQRQNLQSLEAKLVLDLLKQTL
jgi:hypothetical protein